MTIATTPNRLTARCWTALSVGAILTYQPATAAENIVKPDPSHRSQDTRGSRIPRLADIKQIYEEESLDDAQAATLDAMHKASEKSPMPRGKRIPRR